MSAGGMSSSPEVNLDIPRVNPTGDFGSTCSLTESDDNSENMDGRISRVLQDWMPEYTIVPIVPRVHVPREPVFTGRLGRTPRFQRALSTESITTQLSLLSCSTGGKRSQIIDFSAKRKKKKKSAKEEPVQPSKWIALANRRTGIFDKMFKSQAAQLEATIGGGNILTGNRIYDMLDDDEKTMVFKCGLQNGLNYAPGLKKSDSVTNVAEDKKPPMRRLSAGSKVYGKPINFQELQRKVIHQRIAMLAQQMPKGSRKSQLHGATRRPSGYSNTVVSSKQASRHHSSVSGGSCDVTMSTVSQSLSVTPPSTPKKETRVSVWKGDQQILEMDLRRELTSKVKIKIASTTAALNRVTGYGDDNEQRNVCGSMDEFPGFTENDFSHLPKIAQKIRISPHLSRVIQHDIKLRMGRPRYHEISTHDIEMWNRGQQLDRSHRNLKVFNWLHSLQEDQFEEDISNSDIDDQPTEEDMKMGNMVHIEAADEPKVKPLFERMKSKYVFG